MTVSSVSTSRGQRAPDTAARHDGQDAVVARRSRWLFVGTLLALLVVYVPLLGPSLVGQQVFAETGLVLRFEPWSLDAAPEDQTGVTIAHDTMDSALPSLDVWRERVLDGDYPLWSPYIAGGAPLASVPEHALLSPLSLPYLLLPFALAPGWVRLLEVVVAVGFSALFLRRLGLSRGPALLGGFLYSCTAFLVLWNNWPQAQVASLVPALFWSVERALQVRRPSAAVPVALVVASMLLASFPAVMVYTLYLLGPYILVRTLGRRVRPATVLRSWALSGGGLLLGVAVAGFQVLPFVRHLQDLDLSYRAQGPGSHAPFSSLVTLAVPYAFGSETDNTFFGYRNTVELIAYVGVVCLLLALVAVSLRVRLPTPRGVVVLFTGTVAALVLVAFSSDRALQVAQSLPFLGSSFIGRTRAVLCFALAVLAALGAERLVRFRRGTGAFSPWALLPVLVAGGAGAYALRGALAAAADRDRSDVLLRNSVLPLVVLGLALVVGAVALRSGRTGRVALAVLPVLVAVEGLAFITPRWPSEDPAQLYPTTGVHAFLAENLDRQRYAAAGALLFPSTNTYYGLRSVSGHVFHQPTWKQAVQRIDPSVVQGPTLTFVGRGVDSATSPVLDRLSARYYVAGIGAAVFGEQVLPEPVTGTTVLRPGEPLSVPVPPGPRRALVLPMTAPLAGGPTGRLTVVFRDAAGQVVGEVTRPGLAGGQPAGELHVPVAGESGPLTRAVEATLSVEGVSLSLGTAPDGEVAVGEVRAPAGGDGLEVAFVDESVVYERTRALPRVRFATSAVRVQDSSAGLEALASGRLADDAVVLPAEVSAPPGTPVPGADVDVDVVEDSGDVLRAEVDAESAGWLVVADAKQQAGWQAEVDGEPVALVPADHAGVAVALPAGESDVVLRYVPPGWWAGWAVTGLAVLVAVGLVLLGRRYPGQRPGDGTAGPLDGRSPDGREHHGVVGVQPG